MAVAATRDIAAGEELLLSYGERPAVGWLAHVGMAA
jgi:SET domain-containing protein